MDPAQQNTVSSHDQSQSPLFRLPPELRTQIFTSLLTAPSPPRRADQPTHLHPSLLATCRRLHSEYQPLLYSLLFTAHPTLLTSLPYYGVRSRPVPPWQTHLIGRWTVAVRLDIDSRFTASAVEGSFGGAREVSVEVMQAMYGSCDFGRLREFEGVRGVRSARVWGSVGDGRYARWLEGRMMLSCGEEGEGFEDGEETLEGERGRRTKEFGRSWRLGDAVRREGETWEGNR